MTKKDVKIELIRLDCKLWELANVLNVHPNTLHNWFHGEEITEERAEKLRAGINALELQKEGSRT